ncbi:MAG: type II toxin-antitoxin system RelE/ParE family toxin, partial [Candidatus Aminicenantes bacterium]|nr:type II toxin-antitoxin system RelE/ParE family toxin [Candidatus Aminicenantes bacterium]
NLRRIVERIRSLSDEPRPYGCQKLSAQERYRIRQGDYRIVYSIDDAAKTIEIFKIGRRSEIYKE